MNTGSRADMNEIGASDAHAYEIMDPSAPFEDGFNWRTVAAAAFVGLVMMPASMLISMTTGMGIGAAADWVVVILFIEITKRALLKLKTQEILMIYWISAKPSRIDASQALYAAGHAWLPLQTARVSDA